jgi:hypothetical protein
LESSKSHFERLGEPKPFNPQQFFNSDRAHLNASD